MFQVILKPTAIVELFRLPTHLRTRVAHTIKTALKHEPAVVTRDRKQLVGRVSEADPPRRCGSSGSEITVSSTTWTRMPDLGVSADEELNRYGNARRERAVVVGHGGEMIAQRGGGV